MLITLYFCLLFIDNAFGQSGVVNSYSDELLSIQNSETKPPRDSLIVYLLPGQGADYRLFDSLVLSTNCHVRHIVYSTPAKGTTLREYAILLSQQIDTTQNFAITGVSLGGMLAVEMSTFLKAERVIIISSAKSRNELPSTYRFQRKFRLFKAVPPRLAKFGARILQPLVEPDRRHEKDTFKAMLKAKDPYFLRRTIEMIMLWDRKKAPPNIIHIHGNKDNTIPIRNVKYDVLVENGSHMMTLTRGDEISKWVRLFLK